MAGERVAVTCGGCGAKMQAAPGASGKCPKCGAVLRVPTPQFQIPIPPSIPDPASSWVDVRPPKDERLDSLRRQLRVTQALAAAGVMAALVMGGVSLVRQPEAQAVRPATLPRVIEAERFVLVDTAGKRRATFAMDVNPLLMGGRVLDNGERPFPQLRFFADDGRLKLHLGLQAPPSSAEEDSFLDLLDANHATAVQLGTGSLGGIVRVADDKGHPIHELLGWVPAGVDPSQPLPRSGE